MKDSKYAKRLRLMHEDIIRDCIRYETECKDLGTYIMSEEDRSAMENRINTQKNKNYLREQLEKRYKNK